ncbi:hypothetical protein Tco_0396584 [Tanacetum coccineum]
MSTMAENVIAAGTENRPPMLERSQYDPWQNHVYTLVNHHTIAKEIFRVKLLIEGSKLSLQERESKLHNEFDRFTSEKGETIHSYYLRFAKMINDMNTIGMTMQKLQVNIKFVNNLQSEWSKFVTNVKLAKDMHNASFDQLYAYLRQHEVHANEFLVFPQQLQFYLPPPPQQSYEAPINHHQSYEAPVFHQQSYQALAVHYQSPAVFPQLGSCLVVPKFLLTDDPIESLNKTMALLSTTITLRYPQTNNQLRTSSNLRNQATIQDGRVTVQNVQRRQTQSYTRNFAKDSAQYFEANTGASKNMGNATANQARMMLAQAQEARITLDEEQLAFLADTEERVDSGPDAQALTTTAIFQMDDIDAFDSDCDELTTANNNVIDQSVHEMQYSKQLVFVDDSNIVITSDNNVISYDQYMKEIKSEVVQDTSSSEQKDALLMSVIEEMSNQVAKCNAVNQENKTVNESLTVLVNESLTACAFDVTKKQVVNFLRKNERKERKTFKLNRKC